MAGVIPILHEMSDLAKMLQVSRDTVRNWAWTGKLVPDYVTPRGCRLFTPATLDRLLQERADKRKT